MSLFAVKYIPNYGWVGVKNFYTSFKPSLVIKKSFRHSVERLYFWNNDTKYTEGINEHGVCIFSSNIQTKQDPIEAKKFIKRSEDDIVVQPRRYYDPDGLRIRKALEAKDVTGALAILKEKQITGCTIVFDKNNCAIMESGFRLTNDNREEFICSIQMVSPMTSIVRDQSGVLLPWLGDEAYKHDSKIRMQIVQSNLMLAERPEDVLNAVSDEELLAYGKYRAAYQGLLVPSELKLYARSLWCNMAVNVNRLNIVGGKTNFEIGCKNRPTFSEFTNLKL
jgi:hypothetical protein